MEYVWTKFYDEGFPTHLNYPDRTMYELLTDSAKVNAELAAITFMGTVINFRKLLDLVDNLAQELVNRGILKGDVATICLPNVPQAVVAFYALNKLGVVANMVHPLTPAEELSQIIQFTESKYLFTLDAFMHKYIKMLETSINKLTIVCKINDYLSPVMKGAFYVAKGRKIKKVALTDKHVLWTDLISLNNKNSDTGNIEYKRPISPDDCAVYLHSGGTMGIPKTIKLSSANLNVLAVQGPYIIGVKNPAGLSMAGILPLFHGFGLCMGMHTMIVNGITIILVPLFSAESLVALLYKQKPNFIAAVPTLLEGIMRNKKLKNADMSYLKAVFCGGDTLTEELKVKFDDFLLKHNCQARIREGYGMTETVTVCSVNPINDNRSGTVGLPLADIAMTIVEPGTVNELSVNTPGEICITGPTMMLGYLNDQSATDQAIRTHADGTRWIHTGDYGFMDADGYFHFIQRLKRIIKVSGIPVFPSQIEDIIAKIPGVREVSAIGIPHQYKMQVVKVFIVLDEGVVGDTKFEELIRNECGKKAIKYAIPAEIEFRTSLPRTKVGKIDTVALENETTK